MGLAIELAIKDFWHERQVFACHILALAAVLAPLLVLFGLKFGVIDTMRGRLLADPRNREVLAVGSGRFTAEWFAQMGERREVGFILPRTRTIAATMVLRNPGGERGQFVEVELIPSAAGDPLLAEHAVEPPREKTVVLTESAARKLGVAAGATIEGNVTRTVDQRRERVTLPLVVGAVAPSAAFSRDALFAAVGLLVAVEDYRDGFAVVDYGWPGQEPGQRARIYAGYRLYARSIDDVAPLAAELNRQGLEVNTQAAEIETVRRLDRNLGDVFWLIAGIAAVGYLLSLGASLWGNIDRKRRELSVIRLIGFQTSAIVLFPLSQALVTGACGLVLAMAIYGGVASVINGFFADSLAAGEALCRLRPLHLGLAGLATLGSAALAASLAGYRAALIQPSEGVRDV